MKNKTAVSRRNFMKVKSEVSGGQRAMVAVGAGFGSHLSIDFVGRRTTLLAKALGPCALRLACTTEHPWL